MRAPPGLQMAAFTLHPYLWGGRGEGKERNLSPLPYKNPVSKHSHIDGQGFNLSFGVGVTKLISYVQSLVPQTRSLPLYGMFSFHPNIPKAFTHPSTTAKSEVQGLVVLSQDHLSPVWEALEVDSSRRRFPSRSESVKLHKLCASERHRWARPGGGAWHPNRETYRRRKVPGKSRTQPGEFLARSEDLRIVLPGSVSPHPGPMR